MVASGFHPFAVKMAVKFDYLTETSKLSSAPLARCSGSD
jgi:hypothetical protein